MARPTKFDPQTASRIVRAVGQGATFKDAAAIAGISYDTLNNWHGRGQREKAGVFFEFCHALTRAKAQRIVTLASRIHEASRKDWRAAAWMLERLRPEIYGRRACIEHTGSEGHPVQTQNAHFVEAPALSREAISDENLELAMKKYYAVKSALPTTDD